MNQTDQPYVFVHNVMNWSRNYTSSSGERTKGNGQHANGSEPRCGAGNSGTRLRASMCARYWRRTRFRRGSTRLAYGRRAMDVVAGWTGRDACTLQSALRMSNQEFADRLGIGLRTVADWHDKPGMRPRPNMQRILDTALTQAPAAARERFAVLNGQSPTPSVRRDESAAADAEHLTVAIAVVITEQDVLLVCRRDAEPSGITWQFPAGIVKPGVSGAMIAVRETLAETNIHCSVRQSLGNRVHPLSGVSCEYFLCDYLIGEIENRDPAENMSATWVPRADLTRFISADRIFTPVLRVLEDTNDAGRS